jgi:hypothetical protein
MEEERRILLIWERMALAVDKIDLADATASSQIAMPCSSDLV